MDKIKQKIKKIMELANRGVDGEKLNASQMLDILLKKYNLKYEDFEDDKTYHFEITYKGPFEKRLATQLLYKIVGKDFKLYKAYRTSTKLSTYLTNLQHSEFCYLFDIYKKNLKKEMDDLLSAFIQVNRIFPDEKKTSVSKEEEKELTEEEKEALAAIMRKMRSMRKVEIYKQLD